MDKPILGYGVIYGPDHKMRSSFSVAEMWAAIEEWVEYAQYYDPDMVEAERQRVRELLGMEAES